MSERDELIAGWVEGRREVAAGDGFSAAVMAEIRGGLPTRANEDEQTLVPSWLPRPALTSFCMVAGIAKMLLVLQLAFN